MITGDIASTSTVFNGLKFRVDIETDSDIELDADIYDADSIERFRRGDWTFVGVLITPIVQERTWQNAQFSVWGIEYGSNGEHYSNFGLEQIIERAQTDGWFTEAAKLLRSQAETTIREMKALIAELAPVLR